MSTVYELIRDALRLAGGLEVGQEPSENEVTEALMVLNRMIDAWRAEQLALYGYDQVEHALTPNQQVYTIGPTGQIVHERPVWIEQAGVRLSGTSPELEIRLRILTWEEWAAIPVKSLSSTIPTHLFYDSSMDSSGNSAIVLYPVPVVAHTLVLYLPEMLKEFASRTDRVVLPPGYWNAILYNLAVELALRYGRIAQAQPEIFIKAAQYKGQIKAANIRPLVPERDSALTGWVKHFDWRLG